LQAVNRQAPPGSPNSALSSSSPRPLQAPPMSARSSPCTCSPNAPSGLRRDGRPQPRDPERARRVNRCFECVDALDRSRGLLPPPDPDPGGKGTGTRRITPPSGVGLRRDPRASAEHPSARALCPS
jgi:hypothetical protein